MKTLCGKYPTREAILNYYQINYAQVSQLKFWEARILDMIDEVTWDGNGFSDIEDLTIPEDWPMNKSKFSFIRSTDGTKFVGYLKRSIESFVIKPVKIQSKQRLTKIN